MRSRSPRVFVSGPLESNVSSRWVTMHADMIWQFGFGYCDSCQGGAGQLCAWATCEVPIALRGQCPWLLPSRSFKRTPMNTHVWQFHKSWIRLFDGPNVAAFIKRIRCSQFFHDRIAFSCGFMCFALHISCHTVMPARRRQWAKLWRTWSWTFVAWTRCLADTELLHFLHSFRHSFQTYFSTAKWGCADNWLHHGPGRKAKQVVAHTSRSRAAQMSVLRGFYSRYVFVPVMQLHWIPTSFSN